MNNIGSNMPDNDGPLVPATTMRPIIHPAQFFGREDQLEIIFAAWKRVPLEHVIAVGLKRSGKTSLLNYLRFIHNKKKLRDRQRHDWIKQEYNWVFVDFENVRMRRPESFLRYVLKELQLPNDKSDDWTELAEILEDNIEKPTVILRDNIEIGLQLPDLDEQFWGHMRYLGNHVSELGFCVTSRHSLDELEKLAEELDKPSPLINVFGDIKLGPLTEAEARELLGCTSLSKADAEWIIENSQRWPVLLQELCRIRLESEEGEDWKKEGLEKIERYPDLLDSKGVQTLVWQDSNFRGVQTLVWQKSNFRGVQTLVWQDSKL